MIGSCAGFGLAPIAPGTVAALWGVIIYVAWALAFPEDPILSIGVGAALLLTCAVTIWLGDWAEKFFGEKDSGHFVTDEVAGFLFTVLLFHSPNIWLTVIWAFPVTRVIDIIKFPLARWSEQLPKGWGVLADDLIGSIYAALFLHAAAYFFPTWFGW